MAPEPPPNPAVKQEPKPEEQLPKVINIGAGSGERFGEGPNSLKLWTVRWKSAQMEVFEGGKFAGVLDTVTGSILQKGKEVSRFSAERGRSFRDKQMLSLSGRVRVEADQPKLVMTCDRLEYDPDKKVIRALGNVRIEGALGVITGLSEVWTTPELQTVGTPDLFAAGERTP